MHTLFRIVVIALLFSSVAVGARASEPAPAPDLSLHPMIGEPAPEFDLMGIDGTRLSLKSLKGSIVVIHFGTSW